MFLSFNTNDKDSIASYYGGIHNGRKTANGEIFDENKLTAAHKTLKFGTLIKVTNISNNKFVIVRINDRGPFIKGRDIDLSKSAFEKIADIKVGIIQIKYKVI